MIDRESFKRKIEAQFKVHKIVGLLGPRQCGKTTLAKEIAKNFEKSYYFDLEDPLDVERFSTPKTTLMNLHGLIILDEIQKLPEIFQLLRVIHDIDDTRQFLILGSASLELIKQSSESLAGRIGYVELTPLTGIETNDIKKLWLRGGFPKSYLAPNDQTSISWRKSYIRNFLEVDVPGLGFQVPYQNMFRFWNMLTHYHGQIFNASEIGGALNLSDKTVKHYLDILVGTFVIRHLQPWHENIKKRQVKSPKIYFRDSGIYHLLLGIESFDDLALNPKIGASWEGFAIEQTIAKLEAERESYFWGVHSQSELDLLIVNPKKRIGFEFKYTDVPKSTKSMFTAIETLNLDKLVVIYPGTKQFMLTDKIEAVGLTEYITSSNL